jgi:hypothetical protein
LYWSRQVCIRALPGESVEYLLDTAVGKTALPVDGAVAGAEDLDDRVDAGGVPAAAGVEGWDVVSAAGCAAISLRHWLRNFGHVRPPVVPAAFAAAHLSPHCLVTDGVCACAAGVAAKPIEHKTKAGSMNLVAMRMTGAPLLEHGLFS